MLNEQAPDKYNSEGQYSGLYSHMLCPTPYHNAKVKIYIDASPHPVLYTCECVHVCHVCMAALVSPNLLYE